ncbi:MAG: AI-2E family transporter [Chloroflexota bacterium]|nr:AI-2E family transporter [Chloroflexota bacterium]
MDNQRLTRILLILLIVLAVLFLAQMLWQLLSGYADLILLFMLAWLVSFVLNPLVSQLIQRPIPHRFLNAVESRWGPERAKRWRGLRLSRAAAVAIVYVGLLLMSILLIALVVPTAIVQLSALASHLPEYMAQAPQASAAMQVQLARLGIRLNVEDAVKAALAGLQTYAATLIQNALMILTSVVSLLANLFFVLILGFYITLDGPRLRDSFLKVVPTDYNDEIGFLEQSIDRTFGGFIRGQLIQAVLQTVGTAVVMSVLGLDFVLTASVFAGLFMLIPLVGPFLALIPPVLVVLIQAPGLAVWLLAALFILQFVITNVMMPRMMSDAVGLHPLLVFAAILVSVKIAGFWGAFFGIPVAGVLWAMLTFFFKEWRKGQTPATERADDDMD